MKKRLYILVLVLIPILGCCQTLDKEHLRNHFLQSIQRRSALDSFVSLISKNSLSPYEECYLGICYGLQIQYIGSMWGKYKMLDRSRGHINAAIQRSPHDAELRFIRFMLEHNIPSFLGMSTHIREDLSYIFSHVDFLDDSPDLKKMAMEFILSSKRCNEDQKKIAVKTISELNKKLYALAK